MVIENDTIR